MMILDRLNFILHFIVLLFSLAAERFHAMSRIINQTSFSRVISENFLYVKLSLNVALFFFGNCW